MTADLLNNRGKCGLITHGQISKHFTVETDMRVMESGDEAAIRHPMFAYGRVNPRNPETPEYTLTVTTIAIGVLTCTHDRLLGDPEYVLATTTIALGPRDDFFVTGTGSDATFDSGHYDLLRIK
jgi:hypothetical protein